MRKIPKQKFTQEFRQEAVKLVLEQSFSTVEAARRLGISVKTLSGWVIAAKEGQLEKIDTQRELPVSSLEEELSTLRKENAVLREEREILKIRPTRLTVSLMNRNSGRVHCKERSWP